MQNSRVHSQFGENSSQNSRGYNQYQPGPSNQRIMCGDHQGFGITHFCSKISCLKGLCQKCIKEHNHFHKEKKEYADIETVEDINIQCQQRLQKCLNEYSHEQEQIYTQIQSEDAHQKSQQVSEKMNEAERQCQNIVTSYFETVRKEYEIAQRKMDSEKQKLNQQLQDIENEKSKLSGFLRELQDNQFQISSLQHILKLDFSVFINEKLGVIGQYFEQLISVTPQININFENVHRQIFEICQGTCFLSYSGESPKQKSVSQLRNEYSNNIRKTSTTSNANGNIPNEQNYNSSRVISTSPFRGGNPTNPITTQVNKNNNNSSQYSQSTDRNYNEFAVPGGTSNLLQNRNERSISPAPDNRLISQQSTNQVKPNQYPKIPVLNGLENLNSSQQQDDRFTPVSKKMKMKIFDTKPNTLSSPRLPLNSSQQQSLKQSLMPRIEENKHLPQNTNFTPNLSNQMQQSTNNNNVSTSSNNITPNFLNSKSSYPYNNTGFSSFNSMNPQPRDQITENQGISQSNYPNSSQPLGIQNQNKSNFASQQQAVPNNNQYNPVSQNEQLMNKQNDFSPHSQSPIYTDHSNFNNNNNNNNFNKPLNQLSSNPPNSYNSYTPYQDQKQNLNNPLNSQQQIVHNPVNGLYLNNENNLLAPEPQKTHFGQSIQLNNNNPNNIQNNSNNNSAGNTYFQNTNLVSPPQNKSVPDQSLSSAFNRGNSFNPVTNAQNQERDNPTYQNAPQNNRNLQKINEYPQNYPPQQYGTNGSAKQFLPEEIDEYSEWSNNQKDNAQHPYTNQQNLQKQFQQQPQNNYSQKQQDGYNSNNLFNKQNNYNDDNQSLQKNNSSQYNHQPENQNGHNQSQKRDQKNNSHIQSQQQQQQIEEREFGNRHFQVSLNNYFKSDCNYQYLHFFQPKSSTLHIVNIQDLKQASNGVSHDNYLKFYPIQMKTEDSSFTVPRFHKSITLRDGSIFLLGGISPSSSHSKIVYQYDFTKNKLKSVSEMLTGRSAFGCVYSPFNNSIYVIGGACEEEGVTNSCERFDLSNNKWNSISYLTNPTFNPTVCYFSAPNGKNYIYKFGGKLDDTNLDSTIERYDLQSDRWEIIRTNTQIPLLLSSANCSQINGNSIMVFGGVYTPNQEKASACFILNVETDPMNKQLLVHSIKGINQIELPNAEGFSSQQCFVHENQLYTVQNVSEKKNPEIIYLDRKRIICFNSLNWMALNNIELLEKNN